MNRYCPACACTAVFLLMHQGSTIVPTKHIPGHTVGYLAVTDRLPTSAIFHPPLQGLMLRPLTKANVEKHLGALGLEAEFATHAHMRGLSGGQKVKVVLAACTWNQPHILVMDEPTNYLDRDSLGALAGGERRALFLQSCSASWMSAECCWDVRCYTTAAACCDGL
jgi:hypothetical protein